MVVTTLAFLSVKDFKDRSHRLSSLNWNIFIGNHNEQIQIPIKLEFSKDQFLKKVFFRNDQLGD